jgi:hypothetical protein
MIDEQKIDEYRELLVQAGFSENSVRDHISRINGFISLFGDDLSDENIEEYSDNGLSDSTKLKQRHAVGMFRDWILHGINPKRRKQCLYEKGKEKTLKETPAREMQEDQCRYWDNMYNKPAFYKDSHSAQWI